MPQVASATWQNIADKETLAQLAIKVALCANWNEAIRINKKILQIASSEVDALNRLAYAYTCLGEKVKAQKIYKQILQIDPYNIIARKNLEKVTKQNGHSNSNSPRESTNLSNIFLFEPGKTKIVNLINLAPPAVLCSFNFGDQMFLKLKKHAVTVMASDGMYLGALPDDLAHKLLTYIAGGNKYETYIKCVSSKTLTVFIREAYRSAKFFNQPSFLENQNPYSED